MDTWREQILKAFTPQVGRLTLVADPDGLLTEEGILQGIRERGFELLPFEDPVAFRFAYESRYRAHWDRGELTDLVVVLRAATSDLCGLPFDLLQTGRQLSFNLGELFPNLSYPVVAALERADLDAMHRAQEHHSPGSLGDNATKDFALRHVFEIAPERVERPADLLRVLLRHHARKQRLPAILEARLIELLRRSGHFADWPLERIVPDREAFLGFLQERWPCFLDRLAANSGHVSDSTAMEYAGPADLPFEHDDVRAYVDTFFLNGILRPVRHPGADLLAGQWVVVGLRTDAAADHAHRMDRLLHTLEGAVPPCDARHPDWLAFAWQWAELTALRFGLTSSILATVWPRLEQLQDRVDEAFVVWLENRYGGLHNQPPLPPVMLHHVPRALARQRSQPGQDKVALVVLDGIALDQWIVLRDVLASQRPGWTLREDAVFAWIPTLTCVSRQALFAGRSPLYFPASIHRTDREGSLWTQFWSEQGLSAGEVNYLRGLGDENSLELVHEAATRPQTRVLGLVVDKVDRIMHGMELGAAGMHNQVAQWAAQGFPVALLDVLLDNGFAIWLTSDHGNIEAAGCGRPSEGAIADLRGQRVRIYGDVMLRTRVKGHFPAAIEWPSAGLPDDFLPLLAPGRSAFIREGEKTVAHGGASLEEVVVPLVRIEGKKP